MARKIEPGSDRGEACYRAAMALAEQYGSQNKAATATGIKQQALNKLIGQRVLGIQLADQLAAAFDTTVDGLVRMFVTREASTVRAGDLPGWAKAVEEALEEFGELPYGAAAEIKLPLAPRRANRFFVRDLARILQDYASQSHTRVLIQKPRELPGA